MKAPRHLQPATRRWFDAVVAKFVLEDHHLRLLQLAGEAWDRCQAARKAIGQHGLTYLDRYGNPRPRPELAVERDSRIAFARLLREMGLDDEEPPKETGMAPRRANSKLWAPPTVKPWEA